MSDKNYSLTWLPKKTFEILVDILWPEIEKTKKEVIAKAKENLEIKGFRKGKAPDSLVISHLGENKFFELLLEKVIKETYPKTISSLGLNPILSPKVELISAKEGETWQVKFTSCEEPEIKLPEYKEEIKKLNKAAAIWTPGKEIKPQKDEKPRNETEKKEERLDKIIAWLIENVKAEISDLLIESEVNHKLVELLEEVRKLGLTIDQYLASTGKTVDSLKQEFSSQTERAIRMQLVLKAIAEAEKIEVKPEEIDQAISKAKSEEEKHALETQKYLLASILRQQKTLDFLADL